MNTVTQSANTKEIEEAGRFERVIVPLCGEELTLLHVNVVRDESGIIDLTKTKASLQIKNEEAIGFYCCFDWCIHIKLLLSREGYVCNKIERHKYFDEFHCANESEGLIEFPSITTLPSWIASLEFKKNYALDCCIEDLGKALTGQLLKLSEKDKVSIFDKLLPGLKYKTEEPAKIVDEVHEVVDVQSQIEPVLAVTTPEEINKNLTSLPYIFSDEPISSLPNINGLYIVVVDVDYYPILYIGQSINIRNRIRSHNMKKSWIKSCQSYYRIIWIEISGLSLLNSIEQALIEYFDPPLNARGRLDRHRMVQRNNLIPKTIDDLQIRDYDHLYCNGEPIVWLHTNKLSEAQIKKILNSYEKINWEAL